MKIGEKFDGVIVGAGPAGSAAAIAYLRRCPDLKIALVDKRGFPRDKACGDGLSPAAVAALESIGVDTGAVPGSHNVSEAEVHGPGGIAFRAGSEEADMGAFEGMVCRRADLDAYLVEQAQKAGAVLFPMRRFLGSVQHDRGVSALLEDEQTGEKTCLLGSVLVGADGASSRVRKAAGFAPAASSSRTGIAIRAYAEIPEEWQDRIVISYTEDLIPGYGWCFPLGGGTANIGCGMPVEDYRRMRPNFREMLDGYAEFLSEKGLICGVRERHRVHTLPAGLSQELVSGRTATIGDAAAMINPLSGEGIAYGVMAALMLAESTAPALHRGEDPQESLLAFQEAFRAEFSAHFRSCLAAARMMRSRTWAKVILGAASRDPRTRSFGIDLMFGKASMSLSVLLRGAWHGKRFAFMSSRVTP